MLPPNQYKIDTGGSSANKTDDEEGSGTDNGQCDGGGTGWSHEKCPERDDVMCF